MHLFRHRAAVMFQLLDPTGEERITQAQLYSMLKAIVRVRAWPRCSRGPSATIARGDVLTFGPDGTRPPVLLPNRRSEPSPQPHADG